MRSTVVVLLLTCFAAAPATAQRLPTTVLPEHYDITITVDLEHERFEGDERIRVQLVEPSPHIVLNAAELDLGDVVVAAAGTSQRAKVSLDLENETAVLAVPNAIPKGAADIHIRYRGTLNDKLRGFYLSHGANRRYAVTQFESTDARRAFPCFDEPAFKATFAITLVIDQGDTAISNGAVVSDTPGPGAHQHTVRFASSPKMSTYLVAMTVGDFACLEGAADDIPIRICATPDKKALGAIALESAEWILKFYDSYYAIKYPFRKLDVVAVPDFAAGAMENTAAIFYREADLLADSRSASAAVRKNIASVLAHEMAHQWFGDLVTMKWWDDLWLNEGFATWMANHPLAAWKPEWNIDVDEEDENQLAMRLDSLNSTRPIHTPVATPAEIEASFDAIAYQKGAAVLRMIEHYVGADTFRKGVNAYLQTYAYANATSQDFWTAIARTSGRPIDRILQSFVSQPGVPLVALSHLECEDGGTMSRITFRQRRFLLDAGSAAPNEQWTVPVCTKIAGSSNPGSCYVVSEPEQRSELAHGCPSWLFANAGAQGYYRTAYDPALLHALAPHVQDALSAPERMSLAADEWALVRAGTHSVGDYLTLAPAFAGESTAGVLQSVADHLGFVDDYLTDATSRGRFQAWIHQLFAADLDRLGMAGAPNDNDNRRELRATLVRLLGDHADDMKVVAEARTMVDASLAGGQPLDPTIAAAVIHVAAGHGDLPLYQALKEAAVRTSLPQEHYRYLYALAEFSHPDLIDRSLEYALSRDLRSQDTASYLSRFFSNPAARARAWSFVKAHWTELEPKITISGSDTNLVSSLSAFCDPATRDDIRSFFAAHNLPTAARTLDQTVESIDNCVALKKTQSAVLERWAAQTATR